MIVKITKDADELNNAFNEYQLLKDLDHPVIPKLLEYIEDKDRRFHFTVMERFRGRNIEEIMESDGAYNEA